MGYAVKRIKQTAVGWAIGKETQTRNAATTTTQSIKGEATRKTIPSDALVFVGATGDLAYKKIFPALQNIIRCQSLSAPVIGVANAGWTLEQLRERAHNSLVEYGGGVDEAAYGLTFKFTQCS